MSSYYRRTSLHNVLLLFNSYYVYELRTPGTVLPGACGIADRTSPVRHPVSNINANTTIKLVTVLTLLDPSRYD